MKQSVNVGILLKWTINVVKKWTGINWDKTRYNVVSCKHGDEY